MKEERLARIGLCSLAHLGAKSVVELVERVGPEFAWATLRARDDGSAWSRKAQAIDPEQVLAATRACGARFLIPSDDEWPESLEGLRYAEVSGQHGMPFGLWAKGQRLPDLSTSVAIVGSRAASPYGATVAHELGADLGDAGRTVVSGLAYGIDAAAHRGALSIGGSTVAVVASGVDRPYPAANATLARWIEREGTLLSELPPGHQPLRPAFLARNRIIAGLSSGVVVVEAIKRSGAKNTAAWASELGRVLMAVPGAVTSAQSFTPHMLIREGQAVLVNDARDVAELLSPLGDVDPVSHRGPDTAFDRLPEHLKDVREAIRADEEVGAAVIATRTGMPMTTCLAALGELSETGWIEPGDQGGWRLPRRAIPTAS